jgi:hypothetical protein
LKLQSKSHAKHRVFFTIRLDALGRYLRNWCGATLKIVQSKMSYAAKMFSCCSGWQPALSSARRARANQLVIPSGRVLDKWGKGVSLVQQQEGSPELASAVSQQPQFAPRGTHSLPYATAGVRPGVPLRQQREEDLLWIRDEWGRPNLHSNYDR